MRPQWAAVAGYPVKHSLSPLMFRLFAKARGRALDYRAITLRPENLAPAMEAAGHGPWAGWNLTLPHKVAVIPRLNKLHVSAMEAGAVNVLHFLRGRRIGYNTDLEGFLMPLERMQMNLRGRRAIVLGAGGAARAVCAALARKKARVLVLNRTPEKARALAARFNMEAGELNAATLRESLPEADLVVNATSLGLDGKKTPLPPELCWKKGALAYDLVYRPMQTPFLKAARRAGARTLGGLPMLVAQAAATWTIWFDESLPASLLRKAESMLARRLAA